LCGLLVMLALYGLGFLFISLTNRLRKAALNEVAFGLGDVFLGGVVGLMVGWPGIVTSLVVTILLAGAFGLGAIIFLLFVRRYHFGVAIPYAPFIIMGALYMLFIYPSY